MDEDVVAKAEAFARKAHAGQVLNSAAQDEFITHLQKVVAIIHEAGASLTELAAAWLHDVVEDTSVESADIRSEFGTEIADLVDALTDPPHFSGEPTAVRKRRQADRIRDKSTSAKRIKIADQTANVIRMVSDPPVDWSPQQRFEYAAGAKWIVDECVGVDAHLEQAFMRAYQAAMRELGRNP